MIESKKNTEPINVVEEPQQQYGFRSLNEEERLKEDVFRPDIEKLHLFTRMLRRNATLKKATVIHCK